MKKKIIIIGGGAGGMTTASQLNKLMPDSEIKVFEKGPYVSWAGCPTPYFISGELEFKSVVHYSPDFFKERGIEIYENHLVEVIDFENKTIEVKGDKIKGIVEYDQLVLSLGGKPIIPEFKGYNPDLEGLFRLSHVKDAESIKAYLDKNSPKKAVVIGGGFIGLEMAEAFATNGLEVELVEIQKNIFGKFPDFIGESILNKASEKNIKINLGNGLKEILSENGKVTGIILNDGTEVEADIILMSIGIKPNLDLLYKSGFHFDEGNRIYVDEYMKTYMEDVYAVGDMIYNKNKLTGKMVYAPYGDVADKHGIVAARHISNSNSALKWKGVSGSFATSFFDVKIAGSGMTLAEGLEAGYEAKSVQVRAMPKIGGFGEKGVKIEVVYDNKSMVVLGAFGVGKEAVAQFIDQFSIVITMKTPIKDFFNIDFPYSPTNASVWNPLTAVYRKVID